MGDQKFMSLDKTFNREIAREVVAETLKRLETGAERYGANYILADCLGEELLQEVLDLVGYPLIHAVKLIEFFRSAKMLEINDVYWEKFFSQQNDGFLEAMHDKIGAELCKRRTDSKART